MTEPKSIVFDPPGVLIREELEARGWLQRDLAYILGCPAESVNKILGGKRGISPDMARALGEAYTTRHASYRLSQRTRKRVEEIFGWLKTVAGLRKARWRGPARIEQYAHLAVATYNLVRLAHLQPALDTG